MIPPLYQDCLPDLKKKKIRVYESDVVNACIRWLHDVGRCFVWRNNTGAYKTQGGAFVRFGFKGSADIIGCTQSGRFIAVECKGTGGKQSPEQLHFERCINGKNGIYIVAYSMDDLEACKKDILQ